MAPWASRRRYSSFILIAQGFPNHKSQGPPIYPQLHMCQMRSVSIHHKGTSSPDFLSPLSLRQPMWPNTALCGQLGLAKLSIEAHQGAPSCAIAYRKGFFRDKPKLCQKHLVYIYSILSCTNTSEHWSTGSLDADGNDFDVIRLSISFFYTSHCHIR